MFARFVLAHRSNPLDHLLAQFLGRLLHLFGRHLFRCEFAEYEVPMSEILHHGFHRRVAFEIEAGIGRGAAMATGTIRGHEGSDSLTESPRQVGSSGFALNRGLLSHWR